MKRNTNKPRFSSPSSSSGISTAASRLPDDLLELGILSHLPAKALMRLKSVSKNWHRIISSPSPLFVRLQVQRAASGLAPKYVFSYPFTCISKHPRSIGIPNSSNLLERLLKSPYHAVVASCNGFVCCARNYYSSRSIVIVIGNPSLNDWKLLPSNPYYVGDRIAYGMAVDVGVYPAIYTLLLLTHKYENKYQVHFFSSTTQQWSMMKEMVMLPELASFDDDKVSVYAKGTMYWYLDQNCCVLWFNIENKLYGFQQLPPGANRPKHGHIGECGGELSYSMVCGWEIQMWSLNHKKWCKKLSIPLEIIVGRRLKVVQASCRNLQLKKKRQSNNDPGEVLPTFTMLPFEGGDSLSFCLDGVIYSCDTVTGVSYSQDKKGYYNFFPYKNSMVSMPQEEKEKEEEEHNQRRM